MQKMKQGDILLISIIRLFANLILCLYPLPVTKMIYTLQLIQLIQQDMGAVVQKVTNFVSNVVNKVTQFVGSVVNKVLQWPPVKAIVKAKDWLMNETFVGKAINWVGQKVGEGVKYLAQNTAIGRGIVKTCKFISDSPVGKILKFAQPFTVFLGPVGKAVSLGINFISQPTKMLTNKLFSLASPYTNKAFDFVKTKMEPINSAIGKAYSKASDVYQSGKNLLLEKYDKNIKPHVENISNKINSVKNKFNQIKSDLKSKLQPYYDKYGKKLHDFNDRLKQKFNDLNTKYIKPVSNRLNSAFNTASGYTKQLYNISKPIANKIYQKASPYIRQGLNAVDDKMPYLMRYKILGSHYCNKSYNKLTQAVRSRMYRDHYTFYKNYNRFKSFVNFVGYPIKKLYSFTTDYARDRYNSSSLGKKISSWDKEAWYLITQSKIRQSQYLKNIQNHTNSRGNSVLLSNYLKKYSSSGLQQLQLGMNKVRQKFQRLQQNKSSSIINQNIISASFNASAVHDRPSSIQVKATFKNNTDQQIDLKIQDGQMLASTKVSSSQHVVLLGQDITLAPKQQKTVVLQGFCGDSSLKWPHDDPNYSLSDFKLRVFKREMNQKQVWRNT